MARRYNLYTIADSSPEPPCSRLKCDEQINPAEGLPDDGITGCHGEKEEAGQRAKLLQSPVAQAPAEAGHGSLAIIPEYHSATN